MSDSVHKTAPVERQESDSPQVSGASRTVVFDLDGTLLAGDSTIAWVRSLLACPSLRCLMAVLASPDWLPLLWRRSSRSVGASIVLWIATVGRDQACVARSIDEFGSRFERGDEQLRWRPEGLATLRGHLDRHDRVVVVTAAPQWLATRLLAICPEIHVLGSALTRAGGGWILGTHCFGMQKVRALHASGYGGGWELAYSDSSDDTPMLSAATEQAFMVNPGQGVMERLRSEGGSRISAVRWN